MRASLPSDAPSAVKERASPLKRSRAERSEGVPGAEEEAVFSSHDGRGIAGSAGSQATTAALSQFRRPLFPPPPPPATPPLDATTPLQSRFASALGSLCSAELGEAHAPALAYVRDDALPRACRGSAGFTHPGGAGSGAEREGEGQRKMNKSERVATDEPKQEKGRQRAARTPSRCPTPQYLHRDVLTTDDTASRSVSSTAGSWSSYNSAEEADETTAQSRQYVARAHHRQPPTSQVVHRCAELSTSASASTRARGASHPSTLTSTTHSAALSRSRRGTVESRDASSASRGSSRSSRSSSSSSRTSRDSEKEDRAKHYPFFTHEYARSFAHDLIPFLLVRETAPPTLPAGMATSLTAGVSANNSDGVPNGPSSPSKTIASVKFKSWIANLLNLPSHTNSLSRPSVHVAGCPQSADASASSHLVLYNHYVYQRALGKGTFSKVVAAVPAGAQQAVALKVFRDEDVYREACWDEVTILNTLCQCFALRVAQLGASPTVASPPVTSSTRADAPARPFAICATAPTVILAAPAAANVAHAVPAAFASPSPPTLDPVIHDGRFLSPLGYIPHPVHPAIVYPMIGPSLLDVMRGIKKQSRQRTLAGREKEKALATAAVHGRRPLYLRGLPLPLLRAVLYQVLQCLCFMHEYGVVHTDLKPENVLFESTETETMDVPVFALNLNRPNGGGRGAQLSEPQHHRIEVNIDTWTPTGVSRRKSYNDAAKIHSARSSMCHDRSEESCPSFPSSSPGSMAGDAERSTRPGYAADPYTSQNRQLQHTVPVQLPKHNGVRVVDLGSARLMSRFLYGCRYDDVCLHTSSTTAATVAFEGHTPPLSQPPTSARTMVSYEPIQTSHYRSPEVLLDLGWSTSADIFSLGCMIPELVTGDCVFMPNDTFEHLGMLEHVIGPFFDTPQSPAHAGTCAPSPEAQRRLEQFLRCNPRTFAHYFSCSANGTGAPRTRWPLKDEDVEEIHARTAAPPPPPPPSTLFSTSIDQDVGRHASTLCTPVRTSREDVRFVRERPTLRDVLAHCPPLLDLAQQMLRFHPHDRITAAEALRHPFFQL